MAIDLEVEKRGLKAARFQHLEQFVEGNVDRQRVSVTAKNDPGNHAIAACCTSGALACPRAFLGVKIRNFSSHM